MNKKIRVAIYARVSTKHEAQMLAFENQVEWYKRLFERYPEWELIDMYTDEGITATSTQKRDSFNLMIKDAYADKFDLIVTREVSRFARNILDAIGYARNLRKIKKYIFFVTDYIDTHEDDYETKLAYIASIAQEESRKTSVRAKCGQQISMENGTFYGNGNILGYNRYEEKLSGGKKHVEMRINPEQAKTVKMIFDWYLDGWGLEKIKYELEMAGRVTATGKTKWHASVISKILKNPFYCGTIVYRKQYVPDYLEQKKVVNYGDVDNIVVEGKHEPIISKEDFNRVQERLEGQRQSMPYVQTGRLPKGHRPPTSVWCSILECVCGHNFNRRKWNRNTTSTQYGYQCYDTIHTGSVQTRKNKGLSLDDVCDTPMIQEWKLQMMSKAIFDNAPLEIDDIIELASSMIERHINDTPQSVINNNKIIAEKQEKIKKLKNRIDNLVEMRADGEISKEMYFSKKEETEKEIKTLQEELESLAPISVVEEAPKENVVARLSTLKKALQNYADFDTEDDVPDNIVDAFVEKVVVSKDGFDWYLRHSPESPVSCSVEGRKGKANISFAPNTPFTSSQHRLLSKKASNC